MLTLEHFLTREGLVDLLSVATYGNYWPDVKVYKSDYEKGLFDGCECLEDKWAVALLQGRGLVVYDMYDEESELNDGEEPKKYRVKLADVRRGLKKMRDEYPRHWADLVEENDDAITGDIFLQLTVFNEVIYG